MPSTMGGRVLPEWKCSTNIRVVASIDSRRYRYGFVLHCPTGMVSQKPKVAPGQSSFSYSIIGCNASRASARVLSSSSVLIGIP